MFKPVPVNGYVKIARQYKPLSRACRSSVSVSARKLSARTSKGSVQIAEKEVNITLPQAPEIVPITKPKRAAANPKNKKKTIILDKKVGKALKAEQSTTSSSGVSSTDQSSPYGSVVSDSPLYIFADASVIKTGKEKGMGIADVFCSDPKIPHIQEELKGKSTNNVAHLSAIIRGLEIANSHGGSSRKIYMYTDSKYVYSTMNEWFKKWEQSGWKRKGKKTSEIKNRELIQEAHALLEKTNVTLVYMKSTSSSGILDMVKCIRQVWPPSSSLAPVLAHTNSDSPASSTATSFPPPGGLAVESTEMLTNCSSSTNAVSVRSVEGLEHGPVGEAHTAETGPIVAIEAAPDASADASADACAAVEVASPVDTPAPQLATQALMGGEIADPIAVAEEEARLKAAEDVARLKTTAEKDSRLKAAEGLSHHPQLATLLGEYYSMDYIDKGIYDVTYVYGVHSGDVSASAGNIDSENNADIGCYSDSENNSNGRDNYSNSDSGNKAHVPQQKEVYIYTDGSALYNGKAHAKAGYGVFCTDRSLPLGCQLTATQITDREVVTNNIAELSAIIEGFNIALVLLQREIEERSVQEQEQEQQQEQSNASLRKDRKDQVKDTHASAAAVDATDAPQTSSTDKLKSNNKTKPSKETINGSPPSQASRSAKVITLFTDSQYSISCLTEWYKGWVRNGWRQSGSGGGSIKNQDLIKEAHRLMVEVEKHADLKLQHIKSHTNSRDQHSRGNEIADILANLSYREGHWCSPVQGEENI